MSLEEKPKRYIRAGYAPIVEAPAPASTPVPVAESATEPKAENEVNLKFYCTTAELNTLQTGHWVVGGTDKEKAISNWIKRETAEQEVILTAKCFEAEEKTLYHDLFMGSGQSLTYTVTPTPTDSEHIHAEFIPVKVAVQIDMNRLGWATTGYFYHFLDGKLIREYKVAGEGRWTYQVTRSDATTLTDELLSDHHYSAVLLPFKIEGEAAPQQHFLYLVDKLEVEKLAEIDSAWLNENAMTVSMEKVLAARSSKLLYRDPNSQPDPLGPLDQPDVPSPITEFSDVHPYGDIWGWYKQPNFASKAINIFETKQVSDTTPVLNANHMYWPPYNFTTGEEIKVRYTQEVTKIAVLAPEEWTEFFNTFTALKMYKDTATGLYYAAETAKALGGLGVFAITRTVNGVDYVILKNYDKWSQTLLHGGHFKANNPQVIRLGIGALDSATNMAKYVKVSAPLEILVGSAINVLQYIVNDEYTLRKLGIDQAKMLVHIMTVSGVSLAAAYGASFFTPVTFLIGTAILVVSNVLVWGIDQWNNFEAELVEFVLEELES